MRLLKTDLWTRDYPIDHEPEFAIPAFAVPRSPFRLLLQQTPNEA